jgi:hypothetical protein
MEKLDLHYPEVDKSDAGELKKVKVALEKEGPDPVRTSRTKKAAKS